MTETYDAIVIGGGPAGTASAIQLRMAGLSVLIIEKEVFPRYHIGESLTGVAGEMLRTLGLGQAMKDHQFPNKTGVKVIGHNAQSEYFVPVFMPTWQVRRDEFDNILMNKALSLGAEQVLGTVRNVTMRPGSTHLVDYSPAGSETMQQLEARVLFDCSGSANLLSKLGIAGERTFDAYGQQIAVFSQVKGALRDPGEMGDNTFIFYAQNLHWAWFIPLSPDTVSVGIVVPREAFKQLGNKGEDVFAWGLKEINPELTRRTEGKEWVEKVRTIKDYSYRVDPFAGEGFFCVGDSHRFADPIFSFGVNLAFKEATAAVAAAVEALETGSWEAPLARYNEYSNRGQDAVFDFVNFFWKYPTFFGFQMRGKNRKDVVRLFGGDVFEPNEVLNLMRSGFKPQEIGS